MKVTVYADFNYARIVVSDHHVTIRDYVKMEAERDEIRHTDPLA